MKYIKKEFSGIWGDISNRLTGMETGLSHKQGLHKYLQNLLSTYIFSIFIRRFTIPIDIRR